jgi:glycosyltransferase involved in cell wall biosynthesis
MASPKVIIVMPAYNAAKTLLATYQAIPANSYNEIILVDDASSDERKRLHCSPSFSHL